jgi:hypothetical protein
MIYKVFHPTATKYTFFSPAHGTYSKIDHALGHKGSLNIVRKMETISCIFSDYGAKKLQINNKRKYAKHPNTGRIHNSFLNDWYYIKEIRGKIFLIHRLKEQRKHNLQKLWDKEKAVLRRKFMSAFIKKSKRSQINNLKLVDKQKQIKPKSSRQK